MGIIADTFKATLDAMKEADTIRDREIAQTIAECHRLLDDWAAQEQAIMDELICDPLLSELIAND